MAKVLTTPDRKWEIEDGMRTLQRAQEIQKDKALMGEIKKAVGNLNKMVSGGPTPTAVKKKK